MPLVQTFHLEGRENVWAAAQDETQLDRLALSLLRQRYTVKVEPVIVQGQQYGFCLMGEKDPEPAKGNPA